MRFTRKHIMLAFFIALAGLLFSGIFFSLDSGKGEEVKAQLLSFEKNLKRQQSLLQKEVGDLKKVCATNSYENILQKNLTYYSSLHENQGISLYVYEDSILKFWSNNADPIEYANCDCGFVRTRSGVYERYSIHENGKIYVGLLLIKKEHRFENSYVKTYFQKNLKAPESWKIIIKKETNEGFSSIEKTNSMQLVPDNDFSATENKTSFLLLEIICFLLFITSLFKIIQELPFNYLLKTLLFAALIYGVRWAMIYFHFPFYLYEHEIVDPQLFAYSSWFPSLGDLLMNSISILAITYFISGFEVRKESVATLSNSKKYLLIIFLFGFIFWVSWLLIELIEILVFNSNVVLDAKKILKIDAYSAASILGIMLFLYSFILLVKKSAEILKNAAFSWFKIAVFLIAFFAAALGFCYFTGVNDTIGFILALPVVLLLTYRVFRGWPDFELVSTIFLLLFLSLFISATLEKYLEIKENESRKQKAIVMASERDPIAEYLYIELAENIKNDAQITAIGDTSILKDYLRKKYFNKYWDKYDLRLRNTSVAYKSLPGMEVIPNLLYHTDKTGYLAKITRSGPAEKWIELSPINTPYELGFPILLVNKKTENNTLEFEYSFAKYYKGKLLNNKGAYNYPLISSALGPLNNKDFQWIEKDGMNHLIYFADENNTIVISSEAWGVWRMLSSYSYLFILFGFITIAAYIIQRFFDGKNTIPSNFKTRLQLSMLAMLLFSGIIIGAGSIYFIRNQYNQKNFETINEKIKSVKLDVERRLTRHKAFEKEDVIKETLDRFSKVFFTDINLYNGNGQIVASSRPDVFREELVSENMDAHAFYELHFRRQSHFVGVEKIEGMEYLSAYIPLYNEKAELSGYLNLPYFARQNELSTEISNFLVTLINIYGLLIVFSILAALFVSDQITKPLSLIQEKLKNVRFGKRNESIEWKGNDEIGSLVAEYNRMVNELSDSAEKLAKSEREGAWREMAKQVAHEIKNPLTPMKLNVQYLNRLWKEIPRDEFEERLTRISKSLIEQIDTLSSIATEFSNFAKMPDSIIEDVDLVEVLRNCVELYSDENTVNVQLETDFNIVIIKADKDQLLRVFNNLIKNAMQAIPEERKGEIKVGLILNREKFLVTVKDNGKGISENDKEKIFIPNFTTKNSGMGLGLAMVKKIVEGMDGRIWFESEPGKGTCFYIEFKK